MKEYLLDCWAGPLGKTAREPQWRPMDSLMLAYAAGLGKGRRKGIRMGLRNPPYWTVSPSTVKFGRYFDLEGFIHRLHVRTSPM
jgi:hypothetical protein